MPDTPLSNTAELSGPAQQLYERVSDVVGGIAPVVAQVEIARLHARVQTSDLEDRALQRWVHEQGNQQQNIEQITAFAVELLDETALPDALDADWLTRCFNHARFTASPDLQALWARILVRETTVPGSVSKKTLTLVSDLTAQDAVIFQKLLSHAWEFKGGQQLILDKVSAFTADNPNVMSLGEAQTLSALGLISFNQNEDMWHAGIPGSTADLVYFGRTARLGLVRGGGNSRFGFPVGCAAFTGAGRELAACVSGTPSDEILYRTLDYLKSRGVKVFGV